MDHDIDVRPGPADERGGLAMHEISPGVMIASRAELGDARSHDDWLRIGSVGEWPDEGRRSGRTRPATS